MNLLISDIGDRSLRDFAATVEGKIKCAPSKLTISSMHLSLVFVQSEQFSHLINCEFWFSSNV